jgi:hypothetical protein
MFFCAQLLAYSPRPNGIHEVADFIPDISFGCSQSNIYPPAF